MDTSHPCPVCGVTFGTARGMKVHKNNAHRRGAAQAAEAARNAREIRAVLDWMSHTGVDVTADVVKKVTMDVVDASQARR